MVYVPKTEFASAIAQIAAERNIEPEVVKNSISEAVLAAFRRDARERGIEIPEKESNVAVKIIDMLGEEVLFVKEV